MAEISNLEKFLQARKVYMMSEDLTKVAKSVGEGVRAQENL